jgi:hypothetical protein
MNHREIGRRVGVGFVFLWFAIGGVAHFAATNTEMPAKRKQPTAKVAFVESMGACL